MRIAFVLPAPVRVPQGGAAVVFRHAEGLAARGHAVHVVAPQRGPGPLQWVRRQAVLARDRWHGVAPQPPRVTGVEVVEPESPTIDGSLYDSVIATGWQTARWVSASGAEQAFYFLQGDERALSPRAESTWDAPLRKITVATWLADLLRDRGHSVEGVVPNAVAPGEMYATTPQADRPRRVIALYHRHPTKGPDTLVEALDHVREMDATVSATIVAARPPSHRLPSWVDLRIRPSRRELRELYDGAAVALHTSRVEGWGLVPMEAAACGCAVVATASRGPREFLEPGRSMLEVPVGDSRAIARETLCLMNDLPLRVEVSHAARSAVSQFSWADSTERLERLLLS